ncbi:hypothetical protein MSAN_02138200 [Mycena sanguinolenta]|uniref:F-box domain-containing protein n=1 Tax=Mycena sanguinolenta TaxID=230812 RepID=A0A8H7CLS8_9AGAR|nr:hypothetical protein MSAN_02138200 [Mycena sanguinolenta]
MSFIALGDDVLLNILALCDIYRVLTVSAIDKRLRGLAQSNAFRHVLELPPPDRDELERLSIAELSNLVKRAVIGPPPRWPDDLWSTRTPAYTIALDTGLDDFWNSHLLLPGARYIVIDIDSSEELSMFDVWTGRRVWAFAMKNYTYFAVDLVPGGVTARVILAALADYVGRGYQILVEEVDLTTGVSHEVFCLGFSTRLHSISAIVGDFFLYSLPSSATSDAEVNNVALVNWLASTYVVLNYGTRTNSVATLIPGHIVATHPDSAPPHQQLLTVTDLDSFAPYWRPLTTGINAADPLTTSTIPITAQDRLEYRGHPLGGTTHTPVRLSITPSAVYQGAHTIVVYAGVELPRSLTFTGWRRPYREPAVKVTYSLRPPPPGNACGLRLVSAHLATSGPNAAPLTPARAAMQRSGSCHRIVLSVNSGLETTSDRVAEFNLLTYTAIYIYM